MFFSHRLNMLFRPQNKLKGGYTLSYILFLMFGAGIVILGYFIPRTNAIATLSIYSTLFILYFLILKNENQLSIKTLIIIGITCRVCLLFSTPELSDDFYRFIWDGHLSNETINPYKYTPQQLMQMGFLDTGLYHKLNSPTYYTVYPPINQSIYAISTYLGQGTISKSTFFMKLIFLGFELLTTWGLIKLLKALDRSPKLVIHYLLNPLIIMEFVGNLHFECLLISFLVLTFLFFIKERITMSGISLSLAIFVKITPLLLLPFFLKKLPLRKIPLFLFSMLWITLPMTIIFWDPTMFEHIYASMQLYFGHFEFNSSIYQWFYTIPYEHRPLFVNIVKALFIIAIICYWLMYSDKIKKHIIKDVLVYFVLYFLFASSIHPWYITPVILCGILLNYKFSYVWAAIIPLTYITYKTEMYTQNNWIILLEYCVVFIYIGLGLKKESTKKGAEAPFITV